MQTRKVIRYSDFKDGLYHLRRDSSQLGHSNIAANSVNTSQHDSFKLWHMILGHSSVTKLPGVIDFPSKHCNSDIMSCDICHFCKQKRLAFQENNKSSANIFDLIHVDI